MSPPVFATTIHLAGFVTGIALYGMLLVMTARFNAAESGAKDSELHHIGLHGLMPYGVAVLGLVWNVIALLFYAPTDFGVGYPNPWLGAVGFAALGFLPAVVVHSAVRQSPFRVGRWLTGLAYALSAVGGAFQFYSAAAGLMPSRTGLRIMTVGYGAILAVLLIITIRARQGWQRSLVVVALAAFSVSALHLSRPEVNSASWPVELLGHHASLPLILVILYQDYRFAFADLFLRRALSLLVLVAVAVSLHGLISDSGANSVETLLSTTRHITLWVLTALTYPFVQRAVGWFVDRVVLDRVDYENVREQLSDRLQQTTNIEELLDAAAAAISVALGARRVTTAVEDQLTPTHSASALPRDLVRVRIPTVDAPHFVIRISNLAGGRRLLSDDRSLLDWLSTTLARRIDLVRVTNERFERDLRETEILRLATEAELAALRAQLNPHFLFNALTTIGFLLQTSPERALQTLYRLTHLLRAVLRRSAGTFVTLGEELELVESYLAIETARFEERLTVTIEVPEALRSARIPPLLLQPLVENAIKHGIAPLARGGAVTVRAKVVSEIQNGSTTEMLVLDVIDTGAGLSQAGWKTLEGVGLSNIEARLSRYYGAAASFALTAGSDRGARAQVRVPLHTVIKTDAVLMAASQHPIFLSHAKQS